MIRLESRVRENRTPGSVGGGRKHGDGNRTEARSEHQFILRHHMQHEGGDQDMVVPFLAEAKRHFPALASCSMDKGI